MVKVNWAITDRNVSVNWEGQSHIVSRTDPLADRLIKAVRENRLQEIPTLVSAAKRIESFSHGKFKVEDGRVVINGVLAPEVLSGKIVRFFNEGLPFQPLLKFAENLQSNPSYRAVNELFQFLEKNDHPLTESGNFIAYKRVRSDFKDIHSGTFDNSVGTVVEMPRNQVNEDSAQTCSHGLHVANWEYAHTQFASSDPATDVMLEVEVNPADVVSIPADYNQSKMRVCKYTVLAVVTTPFDPGTSLKVTGHNPMNDFPGTEPDFELTPEENPEACPNCGADVFGASELCDECEYDEECCVHCGEHGCEGECTETSEDRYPFEEEFNI